MLFTQSHPCLSVGQFLLLRPFPHVNFRLSTGELIIDTSHTLFLKNENVLLDNHSSYQIQGIQQTHNAFTQYTARTSVLSVVSIMTSPQYDFPLVLDPDKSHRLALSSTRMLTSFKDLTPPVSSWIVTTACTYINTVPTETQGSSTSPRTPAAFLSTSPHSPAPGNYGSAVCVGPHVTRVLEVEWHVRPSARLAASTWHNASESRSCSSMHLYVVPFLELSWIPVSRCIMGGLFHFPTGEWSSLVVSGNSKLPQTVHTPKVSFHLSKHLAVRLLGPTVSVGLTLLK